MSPEFQELILVSLSFLVIAAVYSTVGHAGASGYAAVLAMVNASPELLRPTSLLLNIAVGSLGLFKFYRVGLVDFKKVAPFLLGSLPMAYLSASYKVKKNLFFFLLGILLLVSAARLIFVESLGAKENTRLRAIPLPVAIVTGAVIGFFSGLTGTGGAIFFTPLILAASWARPREASGLSIVFVLANSIFGIAGIWSSAQLTLSPRIFVWLLVVLAGAWIGSSWGTTKFSEYKLKKILGVVLLVASLKLLLSISFG